MSQDLLTIEEVRDFLNTTKMTVYAISKETGINRAALGELKKGKTKEMKYNTAKVISNFINIHSPESKKEALKKMLCEEIDKL